MSKQPSKPKSKAKNISNTIRNYFAPTSQPSAIVGNARREATSASVSSIRSVASSSSSSIRPIAGSSVAVIASNRQDASSAVVDNACREGSSLSTSRSNASSPRCVFVSNSNAIELSSDEKSSELFDSDGNVTQSHSVPVDDRSSERDPSTPVGYSTKDKAESTSLAIGVSSRRSFRHYDLRNNID